MAKDSGSTPPKPQRPNRRQALGRWGEQLAAAYLTEHGYTIVGHNLRTPYGEIDVLATGPAGLLFVEVKTRSSETFGLPETGVTTAKQSHMLQAAEAYLQEHPELEGDYRIDVIAVSGSPQDPNPEIVHFENAIS